MRSGNCQDPILREGYQISPELRQTLYVETEKIRPKRENIYAHVRKGKPGGHQNKLRPQTIEQLNGIFAQILKDYDYI